MISGPDDPDLVAVRSLLAWRQRLAELHHVGPLHPEIATLLREAAEQVLQQARLLERAALAASEAE